MSECEGGERGDLSPGDFLTGSSYRFYFCAAADEVATGAVAEPLLLQVLDRTGVTTGGVVQLHFITRVEAEVSSR